MNTSVIISELSFKASRSSGPGGQHVNKVSSRIELSFNITASEGLTNEEKLVLSQKLSTRINKLGVLQLQCGESRSQHKNKELVIKRFLNILKTNLHIPKKRKPTKPSKGAIKKRLENKQKQALKKANRRKPSF